MKIHIEFDNISELIALNYKLIDALASGKDAVLVSDIGFKKPDISIPESDLCDCYRDGYCWGTKEIDPCYCFGKKSRCTFYKKGI